MFVGDMKCLQELAILQVFHLYFLFTEKKVDTVGVAMPPL